MAYSVARIMTSLEVSRGAAERVRGLMTGEVDPLTSCEVQSWLRRNCCAARWSEVIMYAINEALGGYGVEAVGGASQGGYWQNIRATYCNVGASYKTTVLRCSQQGRFLLTSVGDYV